LYGITEAWAGGSGERIGEIGEYLNTATAAMDTAESGSIYRFGLFFLCNGKIVIVDLTATITVLVL